jgi:hypothetical protein
MGFSLETIAYLVDRQGFAVFWRRRLFLGTAFA